MKGICIPIMTSPKLKQPQASCRMGTQDAGRGNFHGRAPRKERPGQVQGHLAGQPDQLK